MKIKFRQTRHAALPILLLVIVIIVLFFGLRPKTSFYGNNIAWLSDKKALSFNNSSIAYVDNIHLLEENQQSHEFTLQIVVAPASLEKTGFRPILMLHDGTDRAQLIIWHWGASIIVMNGDDYDYSKKLPRISVKDALIVNETTFITITSSENATAVFINGVLARELKDLHLSIPNTGSGPRLILGNSVYGKHGWNGEIYSLAMHGKAFSSEMVKRHYQEWQGKKRFLYDPPDKPIFLYSFNEYNNHMIPDQTGRNEPIQLPSKLVVFKKTVLSPPWHNFTLNQSLFNDAILNLLGFIPLGAAMCCWLRQSQSFSRGPETLIIVVFCFLLSLSMETIQVWLPGRASSQLDILLNSLGAWFVILVVNLISKYKNGISKL